jgi:glycerate kinase
LKNRINKLLKIVIAPNSFKGSLTSPEVADALEEGIIQSGLNCDIIKFPIVDGGSDTMEVLTNLSRGQFVKTKSTGPLGESIFCKYGWLPEKKTAIIGISEASGIHLMIRNDAMRANTFGTGRLFSDAINLGAKTIVLGLGGSATTDGGAGILSALGLKFLDEKGWEIKDLPAGLLRLDSVEKENRFGGLHKLNIIILCDVENPLLGETGSAAIFSPQKGATPDEVKKLEACLENWAKITKKYTGVDVSKLKYSGAAGGVAAGLHAWLNAKLVSGIEFLLDEYDFGTVLTGADYLLTGEGQLDSQTLTGKGPYGVASRARAKGIKVVAFAGSVKDRKSLGCFDEIIEINRTDNIPQEMKETRVNLIAAAKRWGLRIAGNKNN